MEDQNRKTPEDQKNDQGKNPGLNVLQREPGAPSADGPDREPAAGEESAEGKLRGTASPKDVSEEKVGGALSGLDEGETWENDSAEKKKATPDATPEGQKDQQTR